jgi:ABC-type microcin C transport system duplicated ATPase subunit YejF
MSDDVLAIKDGWIVERGPAGQIYAAPREDHTKRLLASPIGVLPASAGVAPDGH